MINYLLKTDPVGAGHILPQLCQQHRQRYGTGGLPEE